ncbi:hypothetical protein PTT_17964 [Pyrenophora teres f. teres 0-1]|uniref:Uncharacterized protein n=1 Tax=Pyrenophora teres f. teres (strain 0-1) TaxID=861557 RepID=E3S5N6_PYRTT|nr:hypothetical protein PTT_17964 [Pyrenophora teres f. teres 0-1]
MERIAEKAKDIEKKERQEMILNFVMENLEKAFMTVFHYLLGAGVGRGGFNDAANARRGMGSKDEKLGNVKVTSIRGSLCKL